MGLDSVELVMEFEDEFALSIPDDEAEKMQTVGDSFNFIMKILRERTGEFAPGVCETAGRFYRVRAALRDEYGIPREMVRPSTEIGTLIPEGRARASWGEFARQHDLPEPPFHFFPDRRFPPTRTTVGELVRQGRSPDRTYCGRDGTVDPRDVWEKVKVIVSEQLGIDKSEIHPHSHYINDLGCD